jgi:hypothetical protein
MDGGEADVRIVEVGRSAPTGKSTCTLGEDHDAEAKHDCTDAKCPNPHPRVSSGSRRFVVNCRALSGHRRIAGDELRRRSKRIDIF